MSTLTMTRIQHSTRPRGLSLALVAASRTAPLLDIPVELGLAILELGLTHTSFTTLSAVSKAFNALVSSILYRHVTLDSVEAVSLFYRTVRSKSPSFLESHIKTLSVTLEPWRFTPATRIELERIVAACTGLRAVFLPSPAFLAGPLSHRRHLPSEVTIQSFDVAAGPSVGPTQSPAAHLSASLTHLRISEPGDAWHSPISILEYFGPTPHLTHLALARRMDANTDNDEVFVADVSALLAGRPRLSMLVVSVFPAQWPCYSYHPAPATSSTIWAALASVAEVDNRLVLVAGGLDGGKDDVVPWASRDFWARSQTAAGS